MASGFFAVLDDITALMDDIAMTSKIATRKTAGILGDDLAVNAEKATGFLADREIPILWKITKGSFLNKLIIVPIALLLSAFYPLAITVILMAGGFYLAYEGVEKIIEYFFHKKQSGTHIVTEDEDNGAVAEKAKIKSAITTDFILSVEIVIIALGTAIDETLGIRIATVSVVALLATVGVYGIVALIVRMDDAGYNLIKRSGDKGILGAVGNMLVNGLPFVIRILSVVGTIALILVAGGIFVHNVEYLHHIFPQVPGIIKEFIVGCIAGLIAVAAVIVTKKVISSFKDRKA